MSEKGTTSKRVIIIGGGLSGLYAANILAGKKIPILLLEAANRVGGRSFTENTTLTTKELATVDQGAGYVGSTQSIVQDLCKHFNIKTQPVPGEFIGSKTKFTFSLGGQVRHSTNPLADLYFYLKPLEFFAMVITIIKTWSLGRKIPYDTPWTSPYARKWDAMTWFDWLNQCFPPTENHFDNARTIFEFISRTPLGIEPPETSLLYYLWYIRAADSLFSLLFFAQDKFVIGGTQQICTKLLGQLKTADVNLSHSATHIDHNYTGVTVTTAKGQYFKGDRVLLAVTPHVRSRLTYEPLVSPMHNQLCQRFPMGTTIKIHLFYSEHIWMNDGYNGNCSIFDGKSVSQVYDVSEPGANYYCLQAFYVGNAGRYAAGQTSDWRKNDVMNELKRVLGGNDAYLTPIGYTDYVWDNTFYIGGAPVGTCSTGTLTNFGEALRGRKGSERIHYAGTETSNGWVGYMEGALRAGKRAANELLEEYGLEQEEIPEPDSSLSKETLTSLYMFLEYAAKAARKIPKVAPKVTSLQTAGTGQNILKMNTDFLVQKGEFDNTDNWLGKYLGKNPEDGAFICEGLKELESFKDLL